MPSSSWERVPTDAGPEVLWNGAEWARGPQTYACQEQTGRGQIQALPYCRSQSSPPRVAKALCPKGWSQEGDPGAGGGEIPLTLRQPLSRPFSVGTQGPAGPPAQSPGKADGPVFPEWITPHNPGETDPYPPTQGGLPRMGGGIQVGGTQRAVLSRVPSLNFL